MSVAISAPTPLLKPRAAVSTLARIGVWTRTTLSTVGDVSRYVVEACAALRDVRTWTSQTLEQAWRLGISSLPLASFIAAFTGIVLALLASYSFTGAVPLYFVGTLVEKTITLELAPVLTGLALAGRVGANIAAELGTMRITEQIDALETLGYDPLAFLVVPRVIAGTVMFPVVVAAAMIAGVATGWLASVALLGLSTQEFTKGLRLFFQSFDVWYGLVKSASFGLVVTLVGARRGLMTHGGAAGVGKSTTSAVVYSAVFILVLDAIWATTWLLNHEAPR